GRPAGAARPGRILESPPLASGQHQQDQGDSALVQPELHPQDEGRQEHGDPGQPIPGEAPAASREAGSEPPVLLTAADVPALDAFQLTAAEPLPEPEPAPEALAP